MPMSDPNLERRLAALAEVASRSAALPMADQIRRRGQRRAVRRRTVGGVAAVVLVVGGLIGFRLAPSPAPPVVDLSPSPAASSPARPWSPTPSPAPSATASAPTSSPTQPAVAGCVKADLSVTLGAQSSATGHFSTEVVFRNTGSVTCTLHGYPGVDGLDAAGALVGHATRTRSGFLGGLPPGATLPTASLRPGQSTVATVEGTASTSGGSPCASVQQLLVTAPGDTQSSRLAWNTAICGNLEVHPIEG